MFVINVLRRFWKLLRMNEVDFCYVVLDKLHKIKHNINLLEENVVDRIADVEKIESEK